MSTSTGKVALGAAHTFRRQWAQGPPPVLRNSNRRLDHVVLLERLPLSTTPSDVARLQDALTPFGMSKRFPSEVVFLRTKLLKPSGRALFAFSRPAHADNFAKLANGKSLGGQQISAQRIAERPPATSPRVALLYELQSQSPGRVVLIQGLPRAMDADRLFRILSRDYQLATDRIEIDLQRYNVEETEASMEGRGPSTTAIGFGCHEARQRMASVSLES
ncbi:hypothetical protein FA10DRAFT_283058 [Acaromyces ingoldii]|uniref:Uncharacterized protein n=1 Tax=Acaromyces ingoldii TaxID=215250 RepID=A0A316YZD5_9BASI|nr:hypothetical protein FA10DRAFT_283058 [Acaromyces ingoldii]PWN93413.1 hypothetical protein FA10DRAFT_283058 [Acaromyces ingoldii]